MRTAAMHYILRRVIPALAGAAWTASVAVGAIWFWKYESTPGGSARAPLLYRAGSPITRNSALRSLVLLLHPHCPCSRASVSERALLMTDLHGRLVATVFVLS